MPKKKWNGSRCMNKRIFSRFSIKQFLLLDGTGAMISFLFLGFVLVHFQEHIGLPILLLRLLAAIALVFAVYSFVCSAIHLQNPASYLKFIGILNLCYSILTMVIIIVYWVEIKLWGIVYFTGEILILWLLSYSEIQKSAS